MNTGILNYIESAHVSEKTMRLSESTRQVVFKVRPSATKLEIKAALEKFFNVSVESVRTVNVKGKTKSFKQKQGKQKSFKKAYVSLSEGHEIDIMGAE